MPVLALFAIVPVALNSAGVFGGHIPALLRVPHNNNCTNIEYLYAFVEAAALGSVVLRYAGVPIAARVSFFYFFPLFFVYLEMSLFPSIFSAFSLYGESVVRFFLPGGVFSTS